MKTIIAVMLLGVGLFFSELGKPRTGDSHGRSIAVAQVRSGDSHG